MAKTTAKLSKQNSVQSLDNLNREVTRWAEMLQKLTIKTNSPETAKHAGELAKFARVVAELEQYISDEARSIDARKKFEAKVKAAMKRGASVEVEQDEDEIDL